MEKIHTPSEVAENIKKIIRQQYKGLNEYAMHICIRILRQHSYTQYSTEKSICHFIRRSDSIRILT